MQKPVCLYSEKLIHNRIDQMAEAITESFDSKFLIIALLKGSFVFVADLARAISRQGHEVEIEFMKVSSYGSGKKSSGVVKVLEDLEASIEGKHILLVDDIVETGRTLTHIREVLLQRGAESVQTCALLDKPSKREMPVMTNFTGFEVDDKFIVGYGIDYAENYRYLPFIGYVQ